MANLDWQTFYDNFWDWSDSTRKTKISSLSDIGPGDEIVEAILETEDEKIRVRLIRKAIRLGAEFTADDFMNLDGELTDDVYRQLGEYAGFDPDDPYFDEDNMEWYDFYDCTHDWNRETLIRRINKLSDFGSNEEVIETILLMPDTETSELLYKRAVACGIVFSDEEEMEIGNWDTAITKNLLDENVFNQMMDDIQTVSDKLDADIATAEEEQKRLRKQNKVGLGAILLGILGGLAGSKKKKSNVCDGDCANCPPHFGYRYDRWYYGHGHVYGCERGGNKGG